MKEGPELLTASFDDAAAFACALADAVTSCIQTSKGSIRLDLTKCATPRMSLQFTSQTHGSCVTIGKSDGTGLSFHIPLGDTSRLSVAGHRMDDASFVTYGPDSAHAICASDGALLAYLVLSREFFDELFVAMLGREPPVGLVQSTIVSADPSDLAPLRILLHDVSMMIIHAPRVLSHPEVFRSIKHAIAPLLLKAYCSADKAMAGPGRTPISRCRTLQRIDEELERHASQPVYVKDLCSAAGLSQATLYRIFYDVLGMSPKRYLQLRRLHLVRAKLLSSDSPGRTVSSAAYDCGFWQLGRMGQAYRELFGETPQKTLQRSRKT